MSLTYKQMDKGEKFFRRTIVLAGLAVMAFWVYSITGGGMTEKDIVCTQGGQAYGQVWHKLWRQEQFDYVCKNKK